MIAGAGSSLPDILLGAFDGSITKVYEASEEDYLKISGLTRRSVLKLTDKSLDEARAVLAYCQNEGVGILTPDSSLYPKRLARISCKPIVLYYRGLMVDLDREVCIAEVGTRHMSEYGARVAYTMAYDLCRGGAIIVSGMAKGIDGMAHRGSLDAGGYTVAVLGCGIDRAYPSEHLALMNEIIKSGLVITEFRPYTSPNARNFPIRNRIVSGLSLGTFVIEAPSKSGALITAETALKQGRDVYALPGKVGELNSEGSNELIRHGAKMVTEAKDILVEYQSLYPSKINLNAVAAVRSRNFNVDKAPEYRARSFRKNDEIINQMLEESERFIRKREEKAAPSEKVSEACAKPKAAAGNSNADKPNFAIPEGASGNQKNILSAIAGEGEANADRIALKCGLSIADVLVELTMLEIEGHITALPGGSYRLNY